MVNRKTKESNEIPDADQSRVFWNAIWSESKEYNGNAEWLKMKEGNSYKKQKYLPGYYQGDWERKPLIVKLQEEMEFGVSGLQY